MRKSVLPPAGLQYQDRFLTPSEEEEILGRLERFEYSHVQMHGVTAKRTVIHFGWDYQYTGGRIQPTRPIPDFLLTIRRRAADTFRERAEEFEEVLINRYPAGAGIGWHRDAPMFGSPVIGVSLLSDCLIRFRHKVAQGFEGFLQHLAARSLYSIGGDARTIWQHSIPKTCAPRYSITFRKVLQKH